MQKTRNTTNKSKNTATKMRNKISPFEDENGLRYKKCKKCGTVPTLVFLNNPSKNMGKHQILCKTCTNRTKKHNTAEDARWEWNEKLNK
jgi:hypothetical protein